MFNYTLPQNGKDGKMYSESREIGAVAGYGVYRVVSAADVRFRFSVLA